MLFSFYFYFAAFVIRKTMICYEQLNGIYSCPLSTLSPFLFRSSSRSSSVALCNELNIRVREMLRAFRANYLCVYAGGCHAYVMYTMRLPILQTVAQLLSDSNFFPYFCRKTYG